MSPIEERLRVLEIVLPDVMPPVAEGYVPAFVPFVLSGEQIHISGRLGKENGKLLCGKVGDEISLNQGKLAARHVAIELLAVLKSALGDLNSVRRIVKLFVMVNGARHFTEPHRVADGASELLVEVFGERGRHARSAVCVAQVPFGVCVEIDMIVEFERHGAASD
jgi:enamine deaminase RidA (YjgF/YER057c/UK114 family)